MVVIEEAFSRTSFPQTDSSEEEAFFGKTSALRNEYKWYGDELTYVCGIADPSYEKLN